MIYEKYEQDFLNIIGEKVYLCLESNIDKIYIAEQLDNVICNLPEDASKELFSILFRIQDNLLLGNELLNIF